MKITWDEPKRLANLEKHGLDLAAVTDAFFEGSIVQPADGGRFKAIGHLDGATVAAIFKPLGSEAFVVISLQPASKKERRVL